MISKKKCVRCKVLKPLKEGFSREKHGRGGFRGSCKVCLRTAQQKDLGIGRASKKVKLNKSYQQVSNESLGISKNLEVIIEALDNVLEENLWGLTL